jgi:spoIIIJ-associated protein
MSDQPSPPPLTPQFENDPCSVLQDMLEMLGFEATVTATELEDGVVLHVSTPEAGRLIGRQGQHLQDLKLLLSRMMQKQYPDKPRKIMVDVEHYLEKQNEELIQRATQAAERVKRWGEPVELPAMNAYDRRIVHQTLASDSEVETLSVEDGKQTSKKRVVVRLKQPAPPSKT